MASTLNQSSNLPTSSLNIEARFAAAAIEKQARLQGQPIAVALYNAARVFNEQFFEGRLLPVVVEVTSPGSQRALADYRPRTVEGIDSHIRLSPRVVARGLRYTLDVLLHELLHAYCFEVLGKSEPSWGYHGPIWAAQCNRVGRMLGLGEVFVRGRGGPNAAQWPMSVRSVDYYEGEGGGEVDESEDETERERKKQAREQNEQERIRKAVSRLLRRASVDTLEQVGVMAADMIETLAGLGGTEQAAQ